MNYLFWAITWGLLLPGTVWAGDLTAITDDLIPDQTAATIARAELGKKLFFDRRLSGDGTMSCSTCHDPEQGYSDGMELSLNYPTTRNWRNSPTLINVAWQQHLFHDGRASTLEEQALFPIMSAFEMNQNLDYLEEEIRSVPAYTAEFQEVFGDPEVTRERIAAAIAAFERTLISRDPPLDRYLEGDPAALSEKARKGYQLFTGKALCSTCHYGVNLMDNRFHALEVPESPEQQEDPRIAATRRFVAKLYGFEAFQTLDEDPGRYLITKDRQDWKAFKTPTLREIALTGPYMHNGIFSTLEEVIDFFEGGGGPGNSVLEPLNLSPVEKEQLIVFLEEALSGTVTPIRYPDLP